MVLDMQAIFSNAQAITATAASTNVLDLGKMGIAPYRKNQLKRNMEKSNKVPLLIKVVENFNTLTSLTVAIEMDDNAAFSSPTVVQSFVIPLANLKTGYDFPIEKLPRGITERYIRLNYTVTGTAPTLGKITAGIVSAVDGAYVG